MGGVKSVGSLFDRDKKSETHQQVSDFYRSEGAMNGALTDWASGQLAALLLLAESGLDQGFTLEQLAHPVTGRVEGLQQIGSQRQGIAADLAGEQLATERGRAETP